MAKSTAKLTVIYNNIAHERYPRKVPDTQRPFRWWNANEKKEVPHRYHLKELRSLQRCAEALFLEKVGTVYEVMDIRTGRHVATFIVTINGTLYQPANTRYRVKE
jgi:hypothetical protein